eukprot:CAMPEP_0202873626 /NCGR_PEP_ID=MMETSP1391-20130828/23640_1 /ASSEMBLY_ACC=CAM_ASM_000867 /TAXON_ID=1034604 /ORGANISM="Chlamydomonas leiostraca, Strain SAG 11-49" /LENGTH=58 /DNA_ID=CAMNT_0049554881 /DNA_START=52 /DNA_END=228 /DNA_ORIENTATION=+
MTLSPKVTTSNSCEDVMRDRISRMGLDVAFLSMAHTPMVILVGGGVASSGAELFRLNT